MNDDQRHLIDAHAPPRHPRTPNSHQTLPTLTCGLSSMPTPLPAASRALPITASTLPSKSPAVAPGSAVPGPTAPARIHRRSREVAQGGSCQPGVSVMSRGKPGDAPRAVGRERRRQVRGRSGRGPGGGPSGWEPAGWVGEWVGRVRGRVFEAGWGDGRW